MNASKTSITQGMVVIPYSPVTRSGTYYAEVYSQPYQIAEGGVNPYQPGLLETIQRTMTLVASTSFVYHQNYVKRENLTTAQGKYCSCVPAVHQKGTARNPYAVCAKTTGTTYRDCWKYYDYHRMPSEILRDYASGHGVVVSGKSDEQIAKEMDEWRRGKLTAL